MPYDPAPRRLTFHCGLPKTGSTFLQTDVFPVAEGGLYLDGKRIFAAIVNELSANPPCTLVSEERLAWPNLWPEHRAARRRENKLAWLARTWPDSNLLLFLREPSEMIRSHYAQYLHDGGTENFAGFFERLIDEREFCFERLLDDIAAMGWKDVLLIDHRDLVQQPARAIALIEAFSGLRFPGWVRRSHGNIGVSGLGAQLLRSCNRFFLRAFRVTHVSALPPRIASVRARIRRSIQRGALSALNRIGPPLVDRAVMTRLRSQFARSWESVRVRIAASQCGR